MIVTRLPMDWPALDWVPAEQGNFSLLRERSDESDVIAAALLTQLADSFGRLPSEMMLLDYGAEPSTRLTALLRGEVAVYVSVPVSSDTNVADTLAGLTHAGHRAPFDVVLLCHVLPYVRRPDRLLTTLARHGQPGAVATVVGLETHGDQHDLVLRAREYDPTYGRRDDHMKHLERWLAGHGIPRTSRVVWSQTCAEDESTLHRIVEFMLGSSDDDLVRKTAAGVPQTDDGQFRIRTAHRVVTWPLRHHLIDAEEPA